MNPTARTDYIVGCIREAGSMYPRDAAAFLAEHDAHRRTEVLAEAADVAERFTERWPDMDAMKADGIIGPHTAFGRIADELRRMAGKDTGDALQAPAGESTQPSTTPATSCPGFKPGDLCTQCGDARRWHRTPVQETPDTVVPDSTQPAPDFFQPGHTYSDTDPRNDWQFRCDTVTAHPEDGERTALGWRRFHGEWTSYAYGEDDWDVNRYVGMADAAEGEVSRG